MSGSYDLHKAMIAAWTSKGLDALHTTHWAAGDDAKFTSLNEAAEASPGQPFPYTMYEIPSGETFARMSGVDAGKKQRVDQIPLAFRTYARSSGELSAAQVAGNIANEIMKVFGGHPTEVPELLTLDNGLHLNTQYLTDFGAKLGDDEHVWGVEYLVTVDVPYTKPVAA